MKTISPLNLGGAGVHMLKKLVLKEYDEEVT